MQSKRTATFKQLLNKLPIDVKLLAVKNYKLWINNPQHPSIKFKCIDKSTQTYSARVGDHYRAVGFKDADTMIWQWIGTHEDYNNLF
jgi:hypothetical protein